MLHCTISRNRIIWALLLFNASSSFFAVAQAPRSFHWYDSTTYSAYLNQDWNAVALYGKEALKNGIDYYYLRMRMGTASFAKSNYRHALVHYRKAMDFSSGDSYARNMKHTCYLELGDRDQANLILSKNRNNSFNRANNPLDFIYIESGFSSFLDPKDPINNPESGKEVYMEKELTKKLYYNHAGLRFRISPYVSVYSGYNHLKIQKEKQIHYITPGIQRDSIRDEWYGKSYHYSFSENLTDTSFSFPLQQNALYLNATCLPAEGWKIIPAFHLFRVKSANIKASYEVLMETDTAWYQNSDSSWHFFDYPSDLYTFEQKDTSFSNKILSIGVIREIGAFNLETYGSWSDFNSRTQYQVGATVRWYPFGNMRLFLSTSATSLFNDKNQRMVYEQSAGVQVCKFAWVNGFVTLGNLDLYNEKNAYLVYNQSNPILFRMGLDALILGGKHLELYIMYRFSHIQYTSLSYTLGTSATNEPLTITVQSNHQYINHNLIGGVKWKL